MNKLSPQSLPSCGRYGLLLRLGCAALIACFPVTALPQSQPKKFYKSYQLLPHQQVIVQNKEFRDVYVHANSPVSVKVGDCSSASTVDLHCYGDPHNVVVVDQRRPGGSEKNAVAITFVED
jgi:hypothetical protein